MKLDNIDKMLTLLNEFCGERKSEYSDYFSLLDDFMSYYEASPYKNPYDANYFVEYDISEPKTSWLLGNILQYNKSGNYAILRDFLEHFMSKETSFDVSLINKPEVTIETGRFDILIKDSKYAVIVENKLKGAVFQRNQLGRYIQRLIHQKYKDDQIYVIILPPNGYDATIESTWKCPQDFRNGVHTVKCSSKNSLYSCWCDEERLLKARELKHCNKCVDFKHSEVYSNKVTITTELSKWLKYLLANEDLLPSDEILLRASITLFADFLDNIYSNRDNDKLQKDMIEFLKSKLIDDSKSISDNIASLSEKIDSLQNLENYMEKLRNNLNLKLLEEWRLELSSEWGNNIITDENTGFYIKVNDLKIGCWYDEDDDTVPYWGLQTIKEQEPTNKQIKLVDTLCETAGIAPGVTDSRAYGWVYYQYTKDGGKICSALYNAAKELGYIK